MLYGNRIITATIVMLSGLMGLDGARAGQTPGTWVNVTPAAASGASFYNAMAIDPVRHSDAYVNIDHLGIWKSTDFGQTWNEIGAGAMTTGTGAAYCTIDPNPNRDPATEPAIYVLQSYGGPGGAWKSTDGGINWVQTWSNNVYAPDGVTSIASDVGSDLGEIDFVDPSNVNHLIASLHGYSGSGGNNGVFETTDGGGKWIVHKSTTFSFEPHNSCLMPVAPSIWLITPNTVATSMVMYRTTDAGVSWTNIGNAPVRGIGRRNARVGSIIYTGTDYNGGGGVCKSTDQGATWIPLPNSGSQISGVAATATKIYAFGGSGVPYFLHAPLANDTVWTNDGTPSGMTAANFLGSTFDGTHYILIASTGLDGIWRYVEPTPASSVEKKVQTSRNVAGISRSVRMILNAGNVSSSFPRQGVSAEADILYNVKGQRIRGKESGRQAMAAVEGR